MKTKAFLIKTNFLVNNALRIFFDQPLSNISFLFKNVRQIHSKTINLKYRKVKKKLMYTLLEVLKLLH